MKKLLSILFLLTFLYCFHAFSQQAHFSQPDIWLLPESTGSRTLMRVNTPDTSYYLSVQDTCGRLINYQPAIVWDTSMHPLRIPYNNTSGFEQTAFVAYHCKDSLNEYGIWLLERDSIWHNSQTTRRFIKSKGATEYQNGGMDMPVINTSVQAWAKSRYRNREYAFILGQSRSCDSVFIPFSGLLAESLVYGECPDRRQTGIIQTYLALKYGISLIANNYVDCRDSILWDYRRDSAYISGIAGLGKDSLSGLDQKQSHSTSEPLFLGISAGHFSVSNGENRSVLQQNDYLLWGHDCGELQVAGSGSDFYPYAHPLLARRWLIRPYGNMRHTPTEAVIHAGALSGVSGPYRLAIDRSGTGNFESVFTEYIPADSVSASGEVFFSNIYWDVDSSGSDLFTIATGASLLCRIQNPSCSNHADGILDIEVAGGVSPYRYLLTHTGNHQRWRRQSGQRIQQFSSLPAGEYILEAYDSENRYLKKEGISLTSSLPESLGLAGVYHIMQGDTLVLDAQRSESGGLYSYEWKKDGIVFNTSSRAQLVQAGRYELIASNVHGCTAREDIEVVMDESELFPCDIYPNPTAGPYEIRVTLPEVMDVQVRVYNINGVFLLNRLGSGSREYSFSGYVNGTGRYFVEVQTPIGRRQLLLIVKR